jgi:hypothetical protein
VVSGLAPSIEGYPTSKGLWAKTCLPAGRAKTPLAKINIKAEQKIRINLRLLAITFIITSVKNILNRLSTDWINFL